MKLGMAIVMGIFLAGCIAATGDGTSGEGDQETDGHEPTASGDDALAPGATVAQAINDSCTTGSVKGLSLQIIEEAQCIDGSAYEKLPSLPNLHLGANVFPYLEKPAHDAFVNALKAHPGTDMT